MDKHCFKIDADPGLDLDQHRNGNSDPDRLQSDEQWLLDGLMYLI